MMKNASSVSRLTHGSPCSTTRAPDGKSRRRSASARRAVFSASSDASNGTEFRNTSVRFAPSTVVVSASAACLASARKFSRVSTQTVPAVFAVTVAVRGDSNMSAISPKMSPADFLLTTTSAPSFR